MTWMPWGANPAGSFGSVNEPLNEVRVKFRSKTSTLPLLKFAAKRKVLLSRARPLYTAPLAELSKVTTALLAPVQLAIRPSSVSKMKDPPPKYPPLPLDTFPVGQPGLQLPFGFLVAPGMVTTREFLLPCASYSVDVPLLLLAIQKSCPGRIEIPHGFNSFGSVVVATPAVFETRLVWE